MSVVAKDRRRGSPLAVLATLLVTWVAGRAAFWESPFALTDTPNDVLFAQRAAELSGTTGSAPQSQAPTAFSHEAIAQLALAGDGGAPGPDVPRAGILGYSAFARSARLAAGHNYLMNAAFSTDWHSGANGFVLDAGGERRPEAEGQTPSSAPFAPRPARRRAVDADRWFLDAYTFYRQGSSSLSPSQGRAPVYGASQVAANLQYRFAPASGRDPRAFVRGYQALVQDGETELAAGLSARLLAKVPVRIAGEVRAVRNPLGTDIRPAGYAVSELPPQRLPLRLLLETYGAAGYVGGEAATYFAEGQASVTREIVSLDGPGDRPMRLSIGGAAWGGAQKDAQRVDVGPTVRLDLNVGQVPARISVDWREQVAGDAAPDSGVAATVSTRF